MRDMNIINNYYGDVESEISQEAAVDCPPILPLSRGIWLAEALRARLLGGVVPAGRVDSRSNASG